LCTEDVVAFDLDEKKDKKVPVKLIKAYLTTLLPAIDLLGGKYVYVADSAYYKVLTGIRRTTSSYGSVEPCVIKGFEHLKVFLGINTSAYYFDPSLKEKAQLSLDALNDTIKGTHKKLGTDVIHSASYPMILPKIEEALAELHKHPKLASDIETKSLLFWEAGLETISFAWDEHNGIAFCIDKKTEPLLSRAVRRLLKKFFREYKGEILWHGGSYDIKVIIYELWMTSLLDQKNMLRGLEVMTKNFGDTMLETFLATNSCAGNTLRLKPNTLEYLGDYAEDCDDTTIIDVPSLLLYNLKDTLGTFWLHKKMHPRMVADNQERIYRTILLPTVKLLLQVELTGMCMDMNKVLEAERVLKEIEMDALSIINASKYVIKLLKIMQQEEHDDCHAKWKTKTMPYEYFDYVEFNPNSGTQIAKLLHEVIGLPIIEITKTGLPATGADVLESLKEHTDVPEVKALIVAFIDLAKVSKIITSFIPAFKGAVLKEDGYHYLHGSFNAVGTLSARLSCSAPNLQTIPSGSKFAKLIKDCFVAPDNYLFCGSDYNALESTVGAKLTQDPNRMKIFTEGWDSHCFNTFYYKMVDMPDIVPTVQSVNSIKKLYPDARQDSKPVTFSLDYLGTWMTVRKSTGKTKKESIAIYDNYHNLYQVSDAWRDAHIEKAESCGFVTGAFDLRVRTPVIQQSLMNDRATTAAAEAEKRSAGNALTQSYCILNSRSSIEFMERVRVSKYALDIKPVALIHDALYLLVRDDLEIIKWVNDNLVDCMSWNDLPELQQDSIPLGGELDIHFQSWKNPVTIPNHASIEQIIEVVDTYLEK